MDTFGIRIKRYRKESKISQDNFGEMLGVSHAAISAWELDKSTPEKKHIEAMAKYFGVSPAELQFGAILNTQPENDVYYMPYLSTKATAGYIEQIGQSKYEFNERYPVYFLNNEKPKPNGYLCLLFIIRQ